MKVTQEVFKTTRDQLVVLVPDLSDKTDGGVVMPETVLAQRAQERGVNEFFEVVAKGPDVHFSIQVGDSVLVKRLDFVPVQSSQEGFRVAVAREYDVVGYYTPTAPAIGVDANREMYEAKVLNNNGKEYGE